MTWASYSTTILCDCFYTIVPVQHRYPPARLQRYAEDIANVLHIRLERPTPTQLAFTVAFLRQAVPWAHRPLIDQESKDGSRHILDEFSPSGIMPCRVVPNKLQINFHSMNVLSLQPEFSP
jgi:hypothetical protein